jgi:hypothetical protein
MWDFSGANLSKKKKKIKENQKREKLSTMGLKIDLRVTKLNNEKYDQLWTQT